MNKYQAIADTVDPCLDCYPWQAMDDELLEFVGLNPNDLPAPPAKAWEVKYPWLIIKCEVCGVVLAEFDAAERKEASIWY